MSVDLRRVCFGDTIEAREREERGFYTGRTVMMGTRRIHMSRGIVGVIRRGAKKSFTHIQYDTTKITSVVPTVTSERGQSVHILLQHRTKCTHHWK